MDPVANERDVQHGLHALFGALGLEARLIPDGIATAFEGRQANYEMAVRRRGAALELASSFPFRVPPPRRAEAVRVANRLLLKLHPASFRMQSDTGRIELCSPLQLEGGATLVRALLVQVQLMDRYLGAFVEVALGGSSSNRALAASQPPPVARRGANAPSGVGALRTAGVSGGASTHREACGPPTPAGRAEDSAVPCDKGAPLRGYPALYEKWRKGWTEQSDRGVFLAGVRDDMDRMRARYQRLGEWERCVDFSVGLRRLQARAQEDIWSGQRPKCAECRGFCCARAFGEGHLRDPYDLALFAVARPELEAVTHDLSHSGCHFLGSAGCQLPRDVRPRVCIMYACSLMPSGSHATPGILALRDYYHQHRWLLPWRGGVTYERVLSAVRRAIPEVSARFPYRAGARCWGARLAVDFEAAFHPEVESVLLKAVSTLRAREDTRVTVESRLAAANADLEGLSYALDDRGRLVLRDLVAYEEDAAEIPGRVGALLQHADATMLELVSG